MHSLNRIATLKSASIRRPFPGVILGCRLTAFPASDGSIDTRRLSANPESPILVLRTDVLLSLLSGQGCSVRYSKRSRQSTSIRSRLSTSMNERSQYKNRIELLQGTLDMLILQTLQWGPQHGYGIAQALRLAIRRRASGGDRITVSGSPSIGASELGAV